jgi:hypothetical protein
MSNKSGKGVAHSSAPKTFGKAAHPASSPKTNAKASSPTQKDVRQGTIILRSFRAKEAVHGNHELYGFGIYYGYPIKDAISLHHAFPVSGFLYFSDLYQSNRIQHEELQTMNHWQNHGKADDTNMAFQLSFGPWELQNLKTPNQPKGLQYFTKCGINNIANEDITTRFPDTDAEREAELETHMMLIRTMIQDFCADTQTHPVHFYDSMQSFKLVTQRRLVPASVLHRFEALTSEYSHTENQTHWNRSLADPTAEMLVTDDI